MKKIAGILFLSMIFDVNAAAAQLISFKPATSKAFSVYNFHTNIVDTASKFHTSGIPANFYSKNLGFFCKAELKLENRIKLPVKFRLGSMEYNNWMEAKPNSGLLRP